MEYGPICLISVLDMIVKCPDDSLSFCCIRARIKNSILRAAKASRWTPYAINFATMIRVTRVSRLLGQSE